MDDEKKRRGKSVAILISSDEDEDDDTALEEEDDDEFIDCDADEASESDDRDVDDESKSDDSDIDDESRSDKVIALLQEGKDIDSLKLNECKAYLRKHGLRIAGNRAVCIARIREHWRLRHGSGYTLYPRSSFNINCTGDVCMGDVVLFRQKVYEKFDKVTRHGRVTGSRTVAGRVVKESYGAAKQQHTFTVEVLWSSGVKKLAPLFPLLVKGRNLYKLKTDRQRWNDEADRVKVLSEKHRRGAAARSVRALKQRHKGSKGSKRQREIQNTKRSKIGRSVELDKVRNLDGYRRANDYRPQEATSSTWNESTSSRAFRSTRGSHEFAQFDHFQVPDYPLYASNHHIPYQFQVNSQRRNEPSEFFYYEMEPLRPRVREFTSRTPHLGSSYGHHHGHPHLYNFDMHLNGEHMHRPLQFSPRARYGWRNSVALSSLG
ncbi:zinc finger CCCH domain-containing protein 62 isoform X2 [Lotus japonicus]|uniref:zinc finger CCCH domain-containing protein 62 isoform X2 n=1 Tax=Lotus japonicus TaxID=34305 RepID=UPI002584A77A|nr:zinc finger CCCH domain-containing protein 62 isoform X2 [Lotus japonicus]